MIEVQVSTKWSNIENSNDLWSAEMFIGYLIILLDTKNLQVHASTFYDKIKFSISENFKKEF